MEILRVENLSFTYPNTERKVIKNVSLSVEEGTFNVLCGATGSGKSTLLRLLKPQLVPLGETTGRVLYKGRDIFELDGRETACRIGFVMQRPEQQIVTDKVWHELAFGLENMGLPNSVIRRRVSEMACYFGMEEWFERDVAELSGGQKQLLNLASVMVMQPEVLILDEPTSQLDPIAAAEFISVLAKLNRELSLTIIIVEHRLEEVIPVSHRVIALKDGEISVDGATREAMDSVGNDAELLKGMPASVRLHHSLGRDGACPLTVAEGRRIIAREYGHGENELRVEARAEAEAVLELEDVFFRYSKHGADVLNGLNMRVEKGEIFCILGGNGSGKSTALGAIAGVNKIYGGKLRVFGKPIEKYKNGELYKECLAMLPQDVQTIFLKNTVAEELKDAQTDITELPFDLTALLNRHPYDLSGGQQQLVGLAKVLGRKPKLLLLDEPTKGIDAHMRNRIIEVLKRLKERGITIVAVSHDVEFAALCADRCALFFNGEISSCDEKHAFFDCNNFYTTAANRMTRDYYGRVITVEEAACLCKSNGRSENACL